MHRLLEMNAPTARCLDHVFGGHCSPAFTFHPKQTTILQGLALDVVMFPPACPGSLAVLMQLE